MKTWEMIKELTEVPNKKFKSIHVDKSIAPTFAAAGCGGILFKNSLGDSTALYYIGFDWIWEEVKQPVTFMEAVKAFDEGKDIYCQIDLECNRFHGKIGNMLHGISSEMVLYGNWYIEN